MRNAYVKIGATVVAVFLLDLARRARDARRARRSEGGIRRVLDRGRLP